MGAVRQKQFWPGSDLPIQSRGNMKKLLLIIVAVSVFSAYAKSAQSVWGHQSELDNAMFKHWVSLNSSQDAVDEFKRLSEKGDIIATRYYAYYLGAGKHVPADKATAENIFKEVFPKIRALAAKGDARAQFVIGSMYGNGEGVAADKAEEYKWYLKSAKGYFPPAYHNLGEMSLSGTGTAKDPQKAFDWFIKAAGHGFPLSEFYLGWMYSVGKGRPQDYKKARTWYARSAEHGFPLAQKELGDIYSSGLAGKQDYSMAYKWYLEAAKNDSVEGQVAVAEMLYRGNGIAADTAAALDWLSKIPPNDSKVGERASSLRKEIEGSRMPPGDTANGEVSRRLVLRTRLLTPPIAVVSVVSKDEKTAAVLGWRSSREWFDGKGVVGLLNLEDGAFTALQEINDPGLPIGELEITPDNKAVKYVNFKKLQGERWRCDIETGETVSEGFVTSEAEPLPEKGLLNTERTFSLLGVPEGVSNSGAITDSDQKQLFNFKNKKRTDLQLPGMLQWLSDSTVLSMVMAGNSVELTVYDIPGGKAGERSRLEIADYKDYPTVGASFVLLPDYNDALLAVHKSFYFEDAEGWGVKHSGKPDVYQLYGFDLATKKFDLVAEMQGQPGQHVPNVALLRRPGYNQVLVSVNNGPALLADLWTKTASKLAMNIINPMALDVIKDGTYSSRKPVFDLPAGAKLYWFKDGKRLLSTSSGIFISDVD